MNLSESWDRLWNGSPSSHYQLSYEDVAGNKHVRYFNFLQTVEDVLGAAMNLGLIYNAKIVKIKFNQYLKKGFENAESPEAMRPILLPKLPTNGVHKITK